MLVSEYARYLAEADLYPEKVAAYRELIERSDVVREFQATSPDEPRSAVYLLRLRPQG